MNSVLDSLTVTMPIPRSEEEEVDEVSEAFNGTSLNGRLIDVSSLNGEREEYICSICNESYNTPPRVLSCLHVFCESCLNEASNENLEPCDGLKVICCSVCQQVTTLKQQDASSLPCDYVLMNLIEMGAINTSSLLCTSCKAKEKAVARCADCPHFLCPNCNSAHQYMRCFENHDVVSLEEIKESNENMPLHKPIYCPYHKQKVEYFCTTCQEIICPDCTNNEHSSPLHDYVKLSLIEFEERLRMEEMMEETRKKLNDCMETSTSLENALSELQSQHDNAKDLINETFQSYKAILEQCRDEALEDLEKIHTRQELKVMDAMQNVEKRMEKIEYACGFVSRILKNGSDGEVLSLKPVMMKQFEALLNQNNDKPKYTTSLEFITNLEQFKNAVEKSFGYVRDPDVVTPPEKSTEKLMNGHAANGHQINGHEMNSHGMNGHDITDHGINGHGSSQDLRILEVNSTTAMQNNPLAISMVNGNGTMTNTVSMQSSPVTSSPLSMPSSFDGDLNFQTMTPQTSPLEGLTTLGEINLTRLASLAACNGKPPSPPIAPPTNVSNGFPLTLLGPSEIPSLPSNLINNIQALAKLGGVHVPESVNDIMTNGYGSMNGMSSFDTNVDASSVLDLVNGTSSMMLNNHGPSFDSGPSSFFGSHSGLQNGIMNFVGNGLGGGGGSGSSSSGGMSHHNGFHTFSRSNSQRAMPLEIHFKFGQLGSTPCQFGSPHGFCIGDDDSIIVADTNNHRIQIFNKDGEFRTQFGIAGKLEGQLWYPRKIEILPSGNFVICDRGNERSRLQLFSREGLFVKKIRLKYVDIVAGMTVTDDGEIVIVDSVQPSLYKLDESGTLSTWFDCKGVMTEPSDIAVRNNKFYICDFKGHCVAVFSHDGQFLNRIGNQGLTDYPNGIDVLPNGNILVGDSHGNKFHICIFLPDGTLLCEYECPYVKVSRCCGLKITSEGGIITVAKNNHHVLVLKSPF